MRIVYFHLSHPEPHHADLMSFCIPQKLGCNGANPDNQAEQEHLWKSRYADKVIKQKLHQTLRLTPLKNPFHRWSFYLTSQQTKKAHCLHSFGLNHCPSGTFYLTLIRHWKCCRLRGCYDGKPWVRWIIGGRAAGNSGLLIKVQVVYVLLYPHVYRG